MNQTCRYCFSVLVLDFGPVSVHVLVFWSSLRTLDNLGLGLGSGLGLGLGLGLSLGWGFSLGLGFSLGSG